MSKNYFSYLQTFTRFVLLKKLYDFFSQIDLSVRLQAPWGGLISLRKVAGHASWHMPPIAARMTTFVDTQSWPVLGLAPELK